MDDPFENLKVKTAQLGGNWKVHQFPPDSNETIRRLSWENGLLRGMMAVVLGDLKNCDENTICHAEMVKAVEEQLKQLAVPEAVDWQDKSKIGRSAPAR